jgi:pimeloyl-ACP methyl ester carboxylesterase
MREDALDRAVGVRDAEPVHSGTVAVFGHRIRYLTSGEGEPVLLLHGLADHAEAWTHVLPHLARRYQVIAPDLLGCGLSDKPHIGYSLYEQAIYLRYLMDAMGIERAHVVGHSLGGALALHLYFQYPERVHDLALIASGGMGRHLSLSLRLCTLAGSSAVLGVLLASRHSQHPVARVGREVLQRFWPATAIADCTPADDDPEDDAQRAAEEAGILDRLREPDARWAFLAMLRNGCDVRGQRGSALAKLAHVQVPVLLVHGDQDATIPLSHSRAAAEALPRARLEVIEQCGHCPQRETPSQFAHVIERFLGAPEAMVRGESYPPATGGMKTSSSPSVRSASAAT